MAKTVPLEVRVIYNAAALLEALEGIADDCRVLDRKDMWEEEGECYYDALRDIRDKVSAALAAPAHVLQDHSGSRARPHLADDSGRQGEERQEVSLMTNLEMVAAELDAAKKKQPKFVDRIFWLPASTLSADEDLEMMRARLADTIAGGRCNVGALLRCELEEAKNAYAHGDLAHAKQELAQCAAVCLRAMEYIENEMEGTK